MINSYFYFVENLIYFNFILLVNFNCLMVNFKEKIVNQVSSYLNQADNTIKKSIIIFFNLFKIKCFIIKYKTIKNYLYFNKELIIKAN